MSAGYISPEHDRWSRVMEYLAGLSVDYKRDVPMPWRFHPQFQNGEPDYVARFRELESQVRDEVERAVVDLIERNVTQPLSEQGRLWLGIRVDVCIQFVCLL